MGSGTFFDEKDASENARNPRSPTGIGWIWIARSWCLLASWGALLAWIKSATQAAFTLDCKCDSWLGKWGLVFTAAYWRSPINALRACLSFSLTFSSGVLRRWASSTMGDMSLTYLDCDRVIPLSARWLKSIPVKVSWDDFCDPRHISLTRLESVDQSNHPLRKVHHPHALRESLTELYCQAVVGWKRRVRMVLAGSLISTVLLTKLGTTRMVRQSNHRHSFSAYTPPWDRVAWLWQALARVPGQWSYRQLISWVNFTFPIINVPLIHGDFEEPTRYPLQWTSLSLKMIMMMNWFVKIGLCSPQKRKVKNGCIRPPVSDEVPASGSSSGWSLEGKLGVSLLSGIGYLSCATGGDGITLESSGMLRSRNWVVPFCVEVFSERDISAIFVDRFNLFWWASSALTLRRFSGATRYNFPAMVTQTVFSFSWVTTRIGPVH